MKQKPRSASTGSDRKLLTGSFRAEIFVVNIMHVIVKFRQHH